MAAPAYHLLSNEDKFKILELLIDKVSHWRDIGTALGFSSGELNEIESMPLLLSRAPKRFLEKLVEKWLQWPCEGHNSEPTVEALCKALKNKTVGLGALAKKVEQVLMHGQPYNSDSNSSGTTRHRRCKKKPSKAKIMDRQISRKRRKCYNKKSITPTLSSSSSSSGIKSESDSDSNSRGKHKKRKRMSPKKRHKKDTRLHDDGGSNISGI